MPESVAEDVEVFQLGVEVIIDGDRGVDEIVEVVQEDDDPVSAEEVEAENPVGPFLDLVGNEGGSVVQVVDLLA